MNLLDNSDYAEKKRTNFTIREKSNMSLKNNLNRTFEPSSLRASYKTKEKLPELSNQNKMTITMFSNHKSTLSKERPNLKLKSSYNFSKIKEKDRTASSGTDLFDYKDNHNVRKSVSKKKVKKKSSLQERTVEIMIRDKNIKGLLSISPYDQKDKQVSSYKVIPSVLIQRYKIKEKLRSSTRLN